ncbi:MAG TPA: hypothetical protein VF988_10190 [Verrucomicrobiae bacterium]
MNALECRAPVMRIGARRSRRFNIRSAGGSGGSAASSFHPFEEFFLTPALPFATEGV